MGMYNLECRQYVDSRLVSDRHSADGSPRMRTSGSGGADERGNDGRGRQEGRTVSESLAIYNTKVGRTNRGERDEVGLGNAEPG